MKAEKKNVRAEKKFAVSYPRSNIQSHQRILRMFRRIFLPRPNCFKVSHFLPRRVPVCVYPSIPGILQQKTDLVHGVFPL